MYASVGSYMARVIRIFDMRFAPFPPFWITAVLASVVYLNFFAHHYVWDMRVVLFAATIFIYARTRIWFRIGARDYWMPLPLAALLTSFFLWIAENVGTSTGTWVCAGQSVFDWISFAKLGSWYLLLYASFATVLLVYRDVLSAIPITPSRATTDTKPPR